MTHELLTHLNHDQRRALENIRAAVERIWARPLHRYFTDHTVAHSQRVIALLDGLTAGMMTTDKRLPPTEVFVLLVAAYLHDIGMQNEKFAGGDPSASPGQRLDEIRAHHNEQTAEMIYAVFEDPAHAFAIPLARDPGLVEAVALVAKGHRRVDLAAEDYDPFTHGGETLRPRLLAALLRFGDELDIDHRRVDLEQMKLMDLPVDSQLHWWKCHYVSGVSIVDEYIRVSYRFPQDRPDYADLIVPLVEDEIRAKHADLEEILRAHAVKVALGPPQVRRMRLVQPLPPEVEALVQNEPDISETRLTEGARQLGTRKAEQVSQGQDDASTGQLRLAIRDPHSGDFVEQLVWHIPHTPADGQRKAANKSFPLYLLNESGKMARYIHIEMVVQAVFLAYPYHRFLPLNMDPHSGWKVTKLKDDTFRCFFEGSADLVCHPGRPYDLGSVSLRAPWGEADGRAVPVSIDYKIAAEKHKGSGSLAISLYADSSTAQRDKTVERPQPLSTSPPPTSASGQRQHATTARPHPLQDHLERRQLAPFLGADLPRETTGLPSRADLARDLAHRHDLDPSLSLAQVAQRVSRAGNRWDFSAFIRDQLDPTGKSPQPFHQRIVELVREHEIETLISTAYDNLLELAFQGAGLGINRVVRGSDVSFATPGRPTLIKLYGDAQQPDTLVVTEDDHYGLWRDGDKQDLLDEVRAALRKNAVLFLGYNLSDPDFHLLWREVLDRAGRFALGAYAVWPGLDPVEVDVWRDRGIHILDTDPLGVLADAAVPSAPSVPATEETESQAWNTKALRELLTAAFSDSELTTLCFDHFRPVYEDFGGGMGKGDKIQKLLDYCDRQAQLETLVGLVEARNPAQYARFAPRLQR